ncbi:hypothetical protein GCM10009569_17460 [Arthrobacter russicus]
MDAQSQLFGPGHAGQPPIPPNPLNQEETVLAQPVTVETMALMLLSTESTVLETQLQTEPNQLKIP